MVTDQHSTNAIYMYIHTYIHYITSHHITLHHITSHHITLHYITYRHTDIQTYRHTDIQTYILTLHYIALHYSTLHYITIHTYIHYIHTYILQKTQPQWCGNTIFKCPSFLMCQGAVMLYTSIYQLNKVQFIDLEKKRNRVFRDIKLSFGMFLA